MTRISPRSSMVRLAAAAVLSLALAGCSDMLTYSQQSRDDGLTAYNQGQYAQAAGSFQNAVKQNPRDYQSFYWLGVSYDASKNYQQAISAYRASLDVQASFLDGRRDIAQRRKTIDGLAIAIAKCPSKNAEIEQLEQTANAKNDLDDTLMLAKVYRYSGDADSAIDTYNRCVLLSPEDGYVNREAGLYFAQIGKNQSAEPILKRVYNNNPQDTEVATALRNMGVVPGPSLKDEDQLAKPMMPRGPIPEINVSRSSSSDSIAQTPRE